MKPLLIFDGDCNFCRRWVGRWRHWTEDKVEYEPYQIAAERYPHIPRENFQKSVHLIDADRSVYIGAEAIFRSLSYSPNKRWMLWLYQQLPGVAQVSETFYRFVACHRKGFSKLTNLFWGKHLDPPEYTLARWLFLRAVALIYLIAFVSLWTQVSGLIGSNGILPVANFLPTVKEQFGTQGYLYFPTLCWLNSSNGFLQFLCGAGTVLSILILIGFAQAELFFLTWGIYLSLTIAGQDFLSFQWDILLLEVGFLSIFFAPGRFLPRFSRESTPSPAIVWLFRFLLFRLMFESGCVKLLSGDPSWRNFTTLEFHYETQSLPTWIGWYAHQLPAWFQHLSVAMMFFIELLLPLLIFLPRRARVVSFFGFVSFQVLIMLTGNYCFFNLLTIALCILLLDDAMIMDRMPSFIRKKFVQNASRVRASLVKRLMIAVVATVVILIGSFQLVGMFAGRDVLPASFEGALGFIAPYRLMNSYGLFAVMTTKRMVIVVEGSDDEQTWLPYEFKWKPGDVRRAPAFVEPHQPRLDWQMWFAALGSYQNNPWFMNLMARLLEGSPQVLALLGKNPFPQAPPRYVRAILYEYHFTNSGTRDSTGAWWAREEKGLYCPVLSLRGKEDFSVYR